MLTTVPSFCVPSRTHLSFAHISPAKHCFPPLLSLPSPVKNSSHLPLTELQNRPVPQTPISHQVLSHDKRLLYLTRHIRYSCIFLRYNLRCNYDFPFFLLFKIGAHVPSTIHFSPFLHLSKSKYCSFSPSKCLKAHKFYLDFSSGHLIFPISPSMSKDKDIRWTDMNDR